VNEVDDVDIKSEVSKVLSVNSDDVETDEVNIEVITILDVLEDIINEIVVVVNICESVIVVPKVIDVDTTDDGSVDVVSDVSSVDMAEEKTLVSLKVNSTVVVEIEKGEEDDSDMVFVNTDDEM
jgi:hypothetical protein